MKTAIASIVFALALSLIPIAVADDTPKELRQRLFDRYDQKNFTVMRSNILVTVLAEGPGFNGRGGNQLEYSINYDFFDPAFKKESWPKNYKSRNLLDEYTTEEVQGGNHATDPLAVGEMARVRLFYVRSDKSGQLWIDMFLVPLSGKRTAASQNVYSDGSTGVSYKVNWGCHFRFLFPPKLAATSNDAYSQYIAERIGRYFIPTEDYLRIQRANATPIDPAAVPGRYVQDKDNSQFLELTKDRKYLLHYQGQDYTGTYQLSGYELSMAAPGGESSKSWLAGDVIIGAGGDTWSKQKSEEVATSSPKAGALTNEDVLKLVEAKLSDSVIVPKIKTSSCKFDTGTESLIKLKGAGVTDPVIQAMIECGVK